MRSVGALPSSPNVMLTISWLCRIVQNSLSPAAELENPLGRGGRSNRDDAQALPLCASVLTQPAGMMRSEQHLSSS